MIDEVKWHKVYLGVGSNIGDKMGYIKLALCKLEECGYIKEIKCSSLIETEPYGGVEQDVFINGAIELYTTLSQYDLLDFLHDIEKEARRERKVHWGPRTLDLDILFYDDLVMDEESLSIPHKDMENRTFVLEPLMELCPDLYNPRTKKTVKEMLDELRSKESSLC